MYPNYVASCRDKDTNQLIIIERPKADYPTIRSFKDTLRANGYSVRFVATDSTTDFDHKAQAFYNKQELQRNIRQAIREYKEAHHG